MKKKIFDEIKKILVEDIGYSGIDSFDLETNFRRDMNVNDPDMILICLKVEVAFKVGISDTRLEGIATIGDMVDCVNDLLTIGGRYN